MLDFNVWLTPSNIKNWIKEEFSRLVQQCKRIDKNVCSKLFEQVNEIIVATGETNVHTFKYDIKSHEQQDKANSLPKSIGGCRLIPKYATSDYFHIIGNTNNFLYILDLIIYQGATSGVLVT